MKVGIAFQSNKTPAAYAALARLVDLAHGLRDPEVDHPRNTVDADEDVRRRHVAVHDLEWLPGLPSRLVGGVEAMQDACANRRRYARLVYERAGRNKRRACRVLDISYHTLQAYLRYTPPEPPATRGGEAWVRLRGVGEHALLLLHVRALVEQHGLAPRSFRRLAEATDDALG